MLATVSLKVFAFALLIDSSRPLTQICIREACVHLCKDMAVCVCVGVSLLQMFIVNARKQPFLLQTCGYY